MTDYRDAEVRQMVRESLRLITRSEYMLEELQHHVVVLDDYVKQLVVENEDGGEDDKC